MRRQLLVGLGMLAVLTVLTGVAYPLAVTGIARLAFAGAADGSLVVEDGHAVGSAWIGQPFTQPGYFHPRPSAAGDGYDASASSGSNLGPTSEALLATVAGRVEAYRRENRLGDDASVPVDAVTASGSGLDPHISVANAELQAARVARARGMPVDDVMDLIADNTSGPMLGFLGEPAVNVLILNLALDAGRSGQTSTDGSR
jgi:K+-transporting ATPase ATPase C chain